jgi:Ca-activated chloride channel homolog
LTDARARDAAGFCSSRVAGIARPLQRGKKGAANDAEFLPRNRPSALGTFCRFIFLAIPICGIAAPWARAQDSGPAAQTPLQAGTELVKVDASVLDNKGNFIGGLARANFRVLDAGAERPIEFFAPVEAPAQILLMIETSPAVYLIHNQHLQAAYALLDGLAEDDEVALVTYDQSPRAVLGFTQDKRALLAALGTAQYTIGMDDLNFYDSVSGVLDWLALTPGKRAIVLLTTGLDSSPPDRWDVLVRKLRGEDVVIFSVALGGALREDRSGKSKSKIGEPGKSAVAAGFARADDALRALAQMTGGRAYFPQSEKDFVPMYHEIASALRHQYVLGIAPAHDGQFHPLTVEVLDASGQPLNASGKKPAVRILAREGYRAPGP